MEENKDKPWQWRYWNVIAILKIYFPVVLVFTLFRIALFYTQLDKLGENTSGQTIFKAFLMGWRFDTVIAAYILTFPFLFLTAAYYLPATGRVLKSLVFWIVFVAFSLSFLVCGADIPYFDQFFSRFSIMAFEWMDSPLFVFKMIFEEPKLWLFLLPVIGFVVLFYIYLGKTIRLPAGFPSAAPMRAPHGRMVKSYKQKFKISPLLVSVLFLGLLFLAMRGRLDEKSPIRVGTAYFSSDPLLNQLGLNPNFTLLKSYLESRKEENKPLALMQEETALARTQEYLGFSPTPGAYPLYRQENQNAETPQFSNVVLILMESMSASKMTRHGNLHELTPFLDSLSHEGYYFENAYSAGIHTFNGIYSTLFSYPALFRKHPMKGASIPRLHSMAQALKEWDYTAAYFTTHDGQFDNVEGFLRANGFDKIISKSDYPPEEIKTTLGVPDDVMFSFAIPVLDEMATDGKPFFAAFMTASDHKPYYIPPYFTPKNTEIEKQIVEYADFSLRKFIAQASEKEWFENTLFVFVADHGAALDARYDIPLSYLHVPLLFYAPEIIQEPKTYSRVTGQIDVFPSVMGLLGLPFENYTLGQNVFEKKRPFIYFNADDKYGVLNEKWLLIVRDSHLGLYDYQSGDVTNYAEDYPDRATEMKTYAEAQLQAYQFVLQNDINTWK